MCSLVTEIDDFLDEKLRITDRDFDEGSWTVSWRWKSDELANLKNRVSYNNKNITERTKKELE